MNRLPAFWIETLDASGAVVSRQRVQSGVATIGRGYENDVVIDDAYVAPAHLRIAYEIDAAAVDAESAHTPALWIADLGSQNGIVDIANESSVKRMSVGDEALIRIGHTRLRIRRANFEVAPALPLPTSLPAGMPVHATSPMPRAIPIPAPTTAFGKSALGMMALFIAVILFSTWLSQTSEFKLAAYLPGAVIFPLLVLGWAGIWTLLTRLVTTRGQFFRHAAIAFAFMLTLFALDLLGDFVSYAFAWVALQKWLPLFAWAMFGALCFAHIRAIAPNHDRLVGAILGALVVVAIGVHVSLRAEAERLQSQRISAKLMPPFLLLKSPVEPDDFFKNAIALKPKLEEERKKEPSSSAFSFADLD